MKVQVVQVNQRRGGNNIMDQAFNKEARDELDCIIARMFYTGGLLFNLTRNPWYTKAFKFAANNPITGYKPPGYSSLRTTLLQHEKSHVERLIEPIRAIWKQKEVSICSDGWADAQKRPLINFIAVTESGPMFLNSVNVEGEVNTDIILLRSLKIVLKKLVLKMSCKS